MPHRSQGDHVGLNREAVLDAALAVADRDGLESLTMRRVAAHLGVEAMTLYHHVENKDAILNGIVERLNALASRSLDDSTPWRDALTRYAFQLRDLLLAHPRVASLALTRPASTPETLALAEEGLRRLVDAGFGLARALDLLNSLSVLVVGHTVSEIATKPINDNSGAGSTSAVAQMSPERFPLLVRAARDQQGTDDAERLRFAVTALFEGFAQLEGVA